MKRNSYIKLVIGSMVLAAVLSTQLETTSTAAQTEKQATQDRLNQLWLQYRVDPVAAEAGVDTWLSTGSPVLSTHLRNELSAIKVLMLCRRARTYDACKLSSALLNSEPQNGHYHALAAHALLCCHKDAEALIEAERSIKLEGNQGANHLLLGEVLVRLNRKTEAIAAAEDAERIAGGAGRSDPDFVTRLAALYYGVGEAARAEAALRAALVINPKQQNALIYLGEICQTRAEFAEAIKFYEKAAALKGDASVCAQAAFQIHKCGNTKKAQAVIDQALAMEPHNAVVYAYKALIFVTGGNPKEALSCFNKALELDPDNSWILQSRADYLISQNLGAQALVDAQKAVALHPDDPYNHLLCASAQLSMSHYREAIAAADDILKTNPSLATAYMIKAKGHSKIGDYWQAIEDLTMAQAAEPRSCEMLYLRAVTYISLRRFDPALADLNQLIKRDPKSSGGFELRAQVLRRKGHAELAAQDDARLQALRAAAPDDGRP